MKAMVETVLGPVPVDSLGKTLMHEHFIFGYPGFSGDCTLGGFDHDEALAACIDAAEHLKAFGVKTVVDPTPNECGRNPRFLKEVSEKTGLQIICATGFYNEDEGTSSYFKRWMKMSDGVTAVYDMFTKEITEGIGKTGIKAGVIKLASSEGKITDYERMFFKAAARVQKETGVTLITHTQAGTMGPEQAELLISEGVDPSRIVIGHMCGNPDIEYQLKTLEYGVAIAFDRFGLQGFLGAPMDKARVACLLGLIGFGYADKLLLSQDIIIHRLGRRTQPRPELIYKEEMANWRITNIFENIVPILKNTGVSNEQVNALLDDNIRRVFGGKY